MKAYLEIVKFDADIVVTSGGSSWNPDDCWDGVEMPGV